MTDLPTIHALLTYGDWANTRLLEAAAPLADDQLDQRMEIGPGSLRRVLIHIYNGEWVWLQRWKQQTETKWSSEAEKAPIPTLRDRFTACRAERDAFLATLTPADLQRPQPYRDSRGSLFRATLADMLIQGCVHSIHHRAQAVNILRRLGADAPELDYMMHVREPA